MGVARVDNYFAHGDTLKEAFDSAKAKAMDNMPIEERIDMFVEEFKADKAYPAMRFFEWHNTLTGSCELGRREFATARNIDLNSGTYTVAEFIELTKDAYNGSVIAQLQERY